MIFLYHIRSWQHLTVEQSVIDKHIFQQNAIITKPSWVKWFLLYSVSIDRLLMKSSQFPFSLQSYEFSISDFFLWERKNCVSYKIMFNVLKYFCTLLLIGGYLFHWKNYKLYGSESNVRRNVETEIVRLYNTAYFLI